MIRVPARLPLFAALATAFVIAVTVGRARAATWDARIPAKATDNFGTAEFRLWVDDDTPATRPLRALLVLAPGWNGDGRHFADDREWRALARELGAGIVAAHWRGDDPENRPPYHLAHLGSGDAWKRALRRLAEQSRRPEMENIPWLLWGHSAGGQLGYGLACVFPEQVAAFVAVKGGIYETAFDPRARGVPGLFVIGERDEIWRGTRMVELFERERRHNAAWAVAWEAGSGHEIGRSTSLARAYLREAAQLRLGATPGEGLRRLHVGQGWVGDRARYEEVKGWPTTAEARARTVWLPGPESASLWRKLGGGVEREID